MDEDENFLLNHYLEIGAVEVLGIEEDGEFIYAVTKKAETLAPELWKTHVEFLDNALIKLYKMGLMEVHYDDNLEASFELSEDGIKMAKELGILPFGGEEN